MIIEKTYFVYFFSQFFDFFWFLTHKKFPFNSILYNLVQTIFSNKNQTLLNRKSWLMSWGWGWTIYFDVVSELRWIRAELDLFISNWIQPNPAQLVYVDPSSNSIHLNLKPTSSYPNSARLLSIPNLKRKVNNHMLQGLKANSASFSSSIRSRDLVNSKSESHLLSFGYASYFYW